MTEAAAVVLFLLVAGFVFGGLYAHFAQSRSILVKWAADNGYQIVRSQYRFLRRGPYLWTLASGLHAVYYVEVIDRQGQRRTGYVLCRVFPTDEAEVRWEV